MPLELCEVYCEQIDWQRRCELIDQHCHPRRAEVSPAVCPRALLISQDAPTAAASAECLWPDPTLSRICTRLHGRFPHFRQYGLLRLGPCRHRRDIRFGRQ
jgi:hypothetical protein